MELLVLLFLRIYAVVYLVLFVEGLALAPMRGMPSLVQIIDMIFFTPVAVAGLWSAAYRHRLRNDSDEPASALTVVTVVTESFY